MINLISFNKSINFIYLYLHVLGSSPQGTRTRHVTPPLSVSGRPSSASVRSREGMPPSPAENQARMIQYLVDELKALLGGTGKWRTFTP